MYRLSHDLRFIIFEHMIRLDNHLIALGQPLRVVDVLRGVCIQ
jgi:hypothetical protein